MVNNTNLIKELYGGKIVIPRQVYKEFSKPCVKYLREKTDELKNNGIIRIESIETDTDEWDLYYKLTHTPEKGHVIIGDGEAAAIAMAKFRGGILASNNMKDIKQYVDEFQLEHITAADIIYEAYQKKLISEQDGNTIWMKMALKKRKLPTISFTDYMKQYKNK